jgi:hypothetical protein
MKIKNIKLSKAGDIHPDRLRCSWGNCKWRSEHHVIFKILTRAGKIIDRLMGLCDVHRGAFRRKFMGWKRKNKGKA